VVAHDEDNGKEIWSNDSLLYRDITAPVAISSYIAVGDFEGYLHIIAQSDGRFVARAKVDGKGLNSPAVVDGSRIYTMGNSGRLSAFEIVQ
jgi:outer membrane protein assembly factor BamB